MDNKLKPGQKIVTAYDTYYGVTAIVHENGKRKKIFIDDIEWYFYIRTSDVDKIRPLLNDFSSIVKRLEPMNTGFTRVYCEMVYQKAPELKLLRDVFESNNVEVFEFDFSKTKRFMIDNNVPIEDNLEILYFDIETDDSKGGISIGRDRILSWAGCDNHDNILFETGDEKTILKKLVKVLANYDIVAGWNSDEFDIPYVQARCELHGIKFDWKSLVSLDMMQRCFKLYGYEASIIGLRNFSLNEVSRCFLGKTKTELSGVKMHVLFETDKEKLREYNIQDTLLLKELDNTRDIISVMVQECVWTGSFLYKFYIGELLDNYIVREAKKRSLVMKSKPSYKQRDALANVSITGGYVAEPKQGLYKHVNICDFKSLYPSIIVGWNIGVDSLNEELSTIGFASLKKFIGTRKIEEVAYPEWNSFLALEKARLDPNDEHIQAANNVFFKRSVPSFIGDLVSTLLAQRAEYKKKLKVLKFDTAEYNNTYAIERVVKEMANSMFGITCDKNSRYFNAFTSEAITYTGQYLNKLSSSIAESTGLTSIYGDTDSIFLVGSDDLSERIVDINEKLKSFLDRNFSLRNNIVFLEYEKHFNKLLLLDKKKYTGILSMKDGKELNKLFSRGTEDIKKSNTRIGKRIFTELVHKVFDDAFTEEKAIDYIKGLQKKIRYDDIEPSDLIITTKVSKPIEEYDTLTVSARLADRLIKAGKLLPIVAGEKKVGTRLEYIIYNNNGVNDGLLLEEYTNNFNRDYYWEVQIYSPLKKILECVYPKVDWKYYSTFSDQLSLF